jgi:hypothetical protein
MIWFEHALPLAGAENLGQMACMYEKESQILFCFLFVKII